MKKEINYYVAKGSKLLDLKGKSKRYLKLKTKIRVNEVNSISTLKTFGKKVYVEIVKNNRLSILIGKSEYVIYNYFLKFKIKEIRIENNKIKIKYSYNNKLNKIEKIGISIFDKEQDLNLKTGEVDFDKFDFQTSELDFSKLVKIRIIFTNKKYQEKWNLELPISYKKEIEYHYQKEKILFKKQKNKLSTIYLGSDKVANLLKNQEKDNFIELAFKGEEKETFGRGYYLAPYGGYTYLIKTLKETENKFTDMIAEKENGKKKKIYSQILLFFLYYFCKFFGYLTYVKAKVFVNKFFKKNKVYSYYIENLGKREVIKDSYLIEGFNGNEFNGNMFYITEQLLYLNKKVCLCVNPRSLKKIKKLIKAYALDIEIIVKNKKIYAKKLLESEYILNDTTMPRFYIKQKGQKVINSWHGTPLKYMGKRINEAPLDLANTQRNFLFTDYLIVSNEFTKEVFLNDYMIKNLKKEEIIVGPSPRNGILLEENLENSQRAINKKSTKKIKILWMPTWRGIGNQNNAIIKNLELFKRMELIVNELDSSKYTFYVKAHQLINNYLDKDEYKMKFVGDDIEIYDFLKNVDILITDYSSIMYDFALTKRKIILDIYDIDEYLEDRGLYENMNNLPFLKAKNKAELLENIREEEREFDYSEINKKYNQFDNENGVDDFICMFKKKKQLINNQKQKILIYPGNLLSNGITTSFLNLLENIKNEEKYNLFVWLPTQIIKMDKIENILPILEKGIDYLATPGGIIIKNEEKKEYDKFLKKLPLTRAENKKVNNIFRREAERLFGNMRFDHLIHFTGYDSYAAKLFENMSGKKHIYVHNNMKEELRLRNNFNEQVIWQFYKKAETINIVNEEVKEKLIKEYFTKEIAEKIKLVHNTIDFEKILRKADEKEESITLNIEEILDNKEIIKFINIARFSPEKGLDRLINAFENVKNNNPEKQMVLFLIGGHGVEKEKIKNLIKIKNLEKDIYIYENINPLPILKKSNLFVLSSYHEGLPMVFFESLVLKVPILSTEIPGPKAFLEEGYGNICENSTTGLIKGMEAYLNGNLNTKIKDLHEFNQKAITEFNEMIEKREE